MGAKIILMHARNGKRLGVLLFLVVVVFVVILSLEGEHFLVSSEQQFNPSIYWKQQEQEQPQQQEGKKKNDNATDVVPSCRRHCRFRTNIIVLNVAFLGREGLNDRQAIFKSFAEWAGYLCATLYVSPPYQMLAPKHNGGKDVSTNLTWADFKVFSFLDDDADNDNGDNDEERVVLKDYVIGRKTFPPPPPPLLPANDDDDNNNTNNTSNKNQITSTTTKSSWLKLILTGNTPFPVHAKKLIAFVDAQQQQHQQNQHQHPNSSSSTSSNRSSSASVLLRSNTAFIWEIRMMPWGFFHALDESLASTLLGVGAATPPTTTAATTTTTALTAPTTASSNKNDSSASTWLVGGAAAAAPSHSSDTNEDVLAGTNTIMINPAAAAVTAAAAAISALPHPAGRCRYVQSRRGDTVTSLVEQTFDSILRGQEQEESAAAAAAAGTNGAGSASGSGSNSNSNLLVYYHIRRGDSATRCDTSLRRMYDYLLCSFRGGGGGGGGGGGQIIMTSNMTTTSLSLSSNSSSTPTTRTRRNLFGKKKNKVKNDINNNNNNNNNNITVLLSTDEWDPCYRKGIQQIVQQGLGYGFVDLDATIRTVLNNHIMNASSKNDHDDADDASSADNAANSNADPHRLDNNYFVYYLSQQVASDPRIIVKLEHRRQYSCKDCETDLLGRFKNQSRAKTIMQQGHHQQQQGLTITTITTSSSSSSSSSSNTYYESDEATFPNNHLVLDLNFTTLEEQYWKCNNSTTNRSSAQKG